MNREEFLAQLREMLDGKVPEQIIADNVKYYKSYINSQTAGGLSEDEVLRMLGDPRLLAKTIEESSKFASGGGDPGGYADERGFYNSFPSGSNTYTEPEDGKHIRLPGWLIAGLVILVSVLALAVVFRVFVFFAPVIIVFALAAFVYKAAKEWFK